MTAVGTDVAVSEPSAFLPVTWTRIVLPWSAALAVYSLPVAPAMSWHAPPLLSQMRHWYVNVGVGVPVHVPLSAFSNSPT